MEIVMVIFGILLIFVLYYIVVHNKFVRVFNKVDEALSGIDVALARRHDTLTNMVEVVKGYVKYEKDILVKLVELRNNPTMNERVEVEEAQTAAKVRLVALQESYPDLKASQNFLELQRTIRDVEEHLSASRRMYNANVTIYNDLLYSFPSSMVAKGMNAERREYFEAASEQKEKVEIEL
jgi:Uncharacterized conserved protein